MTNLEKIQSKNANKMASFLNSITWHCSLKKCKGCPLYNPDEFCDFNTIKKFLESEAEE